MNMRDFNLETVLRGRNSVDSKSSLKGAQRQGSPFIKKGQSNRPDDAASPENVKRTSQLHQSQSNK